MPVHGPPTASGQGAEPYSYRDQQPSSHHSRLPSNSFSLPSIRNIEAGATPPHQQLHPAYQQYSIQSQHPFPPPPYPPAQSQPSHHAMTSPHPLPPPINMSSGQYPYPPGQQPLPPPPGPGMSMNHDPNAAARFPLPLADSRMMSGGRHKKEIKRRTKTGCLTCRKRRIKCDEEHPTCRNCQKSKRECLGYDPIFKPQPGPTNIQPAPNAPTSVHTPPTTASSFQPPLTGYAPATAHHQYPSAMPVGAPPTAAMPQSYNYNAIDPALEGATAQMEVNLYDGSHEAQLGAKPTTIEELLNVGPNLSPPHIPQLSQALPLEKREAIISVFGSIYGHGLDRFFETRWFTLCGVQHLLNDWRLLEKYSVLIDRFSITAEKDGHHENYITQSLETHVIWETALLCRQVSASIQTTNTPNNQIDVDNGVHDAAKRVKAFECLITNQQADAEFPTKIDEFYDPSRQSGHAGLNRQLSDRERAFWKQIAVFCSLKDDSATTAALDPNVDPAMAPAQTETESAKIEQSLKEMRMLLDSRENRDILYSIAIARHVGQRMAEKALKEGTEPRVPQPATESEEDPAYKLKIARMFIRDESSGKGTTQVASRICGMAVRAWGAR